jgi:hypothetical protein
MAATIRFHVLIYKDVPCSSVRPWLLMRGGPRDSEPRTSAVVTISTKTLTLCDSSPCLPCDLILALVGYFMTLTQSQMYLTTNGQSASLSWYEATIWDLQPILPSLSRKLSSDNCRFLYMAPSLTRGWIYNLFVQLPLDRASTVILGSKSRQDLRPLLTLWFKT